METHKKSETSENGENSEIDINNITLKWNIVEAKVFLTNFENENEHEHEHENERENKHDHENNNISDIDKVLHFYYKLKKYSRNSKNKKKKHHPNAQINDNNAKYLIDTYIKNFYKKFLEQNKYSNNNIFTELLQHRIIDKKGAINQYFDKIYVLNLDRRPDRMENMVRRLKRWGITNYVRYSAIDGSETPHWEEWKHYTKSKLNRIEKVRYRRKAIGSAGSWAILKSMFHLIRDAQINKYNRILVLQDDVLFHKNFTEEFNKMKDYIPNDKWKLLFLGATQHNWRHVLKSKHYYYPNGTADGAFAVGIHSSLYDEMIEEILKFDMPVDSGALSRLQKKYLYNSFVIYPNLIIADIRDSDLRSSRDLHNFGKRFKWDPKLYEIDD